MYFYIMSKDYRKQLPSGHSQQQGGNSGVRQESPRQQEKPDVILPVINNRSFSKDMYRSTTARSMSAV